MRSPQLLQLRQPAPPGTISRPGWHLLEPVPGRLQPLPGRNGVGLINDTYNANPDSVRAAIDILASAPGRRYLVLGELAEMGEDAASFYREIG